MRFSPFTSPRYLSADVDLSQPLINTIDIADRKFGYLYVFTSSKTSIILRLSQCFLSPFVHYSGCYIVVAVRLVLNISAHCRRHPAGGEVTKWGNIK